MENVSSRNCVPVVSNNSCLGLSSSQKKEGHLRGPPRGQHGAALKAHLRHVQI